MKKEFENNPHRRTDLRVIGRSYGVKELPDGSLIRRKICLNSLYGALGNQYFRHYKLANAEAITLTGQVAIRWIERKLNEYINKVLSTKGVDYVIASDTDSIYLNLGPLLTVSIPMGWVPRVLMY